ncbi:glycine-rich domain-containing protein [Tomitella gaofuii]|uniref:glycine-rich domain-containing protein n=1 Tax=Tomitella gaofuii TaxID=2760083 RepID=UPI0015FD15FC|nr:hypothetical protein [Tomitella gaofuii]
MTAPGHREYSINVHVFIASGIWHKPPNLATVYVILRGAGGGGGVSSTSGGGGGGAAVITERLHESQVDDTVAVTVGASSAGEDGGDSTFGDITAQGGKAGGSSGRAMGGVSPWRGGMGAEAGNNDGESVSNLPVGALSGGGGGASGSGHGGLSGPNLLVDGTTSGTADLLWPEWLQSGNGGSLHQGQGNTYPAGGGGSQQAGAAGMVTVMETLVHEIPGGP